ncbi:Uncharacterised protein [Enterobacter hormaechei]|uniref:ead/Ea22-like family protein n=1 Tax=Enterobacter hormaechei TaxID=158836 RepID=UPI00125C2553|nr:ead/Ea22-like family protein [Enterobacter hormaechei]VAF12957.1 Uncharacterised protein [Enterobacter hormaechei]
MSNIDKQALREAANAANSASWGNWESYKPHKGARGYEVKVGSKAVAQHCLKVDSAFIAAANPATVLALLDELESAEKRIAELEARAVKPVAWMRNANVTSFMSRFTTDEKYAVEQWGDDAVALYPLPVAFIPACFTDERNLMHINERGRETSLIWSKQNSDSGDIKLFRIAAAAGKGE